MPRTATAETHPVRIEDLRLIKPGEPDFDRLSNMVEGAICAFQSLGSAYTLPKKLTLETQQGPVSVLMGHTETVPYTHDPCAWCVKFRPQDLTAHEHIQVCAENQDLPVLDGESYPDVVISMPTGMIYAWEEIAISPHLDVAAACELMSEIEEKNWTELALIQLQAQMTTFERMEPDADIDMLRQFYKRLFEQKEVDPQDVTLFSRTLEDQIRQRGGIAKALRYFQWISFSPKPGQDLQKALIYINPF